MAQRDESFNEFLRSFKAKNEHKWANIIDATQDEQEEILLNKSPEYRRNEMIMLEEFRRRKNMKVYLDARKKMDSDKYPFAAEEINKEHGKISNRYEDRFKGIGPERFFEHQGEEIYDASEFTLLFMDSDSVTNVTRLNRVN